jgi:hypothetical protein
VGLAVPDARADGGHFPNQAHHEGNTMTNQNENRYQFRPGMIRIEGDVTTHHVAMDLPNGREAMVALKIGAYGPSDAEARRAEFLQTVYPPSLTEPLEKELAKLTAQFNDFTGYDKTGQPLYRVQGREREVLEMRMANRRSALALARQERAVAERVQAQAKAAKQAEQERIEAAARERAQQLIEEAEIERRAKQIAARTAGVRD